MWTGARWRAWLRWTHLLGDRLEEEDTLAVEVVEGVEPNESAVRGRLRGHAAARRSRVSGGELRANAALGRGFGGLAHKAFQRASQSSTTSC